MATTGATNPEELALAELNVDATPQQSTKPSDTLFGPNIGAVPTGPAWTESSRKPAPPGDELTVDILKSWIAKSKEATHATTTLQALVNLKRPTLRLSPLKPEEDENAEHAVHAHLHALEFEYDCDAPKCQLVVHAVLPADHPEAAGKQAVDGYVQAELFSTTQDGGFGRHLRLEDQVILELGRLEHIPKKEDVAQPTADSASAPADSTGTGQRPTLRDRRSRRLTFHLRRRTTNRVNAQRAVAGPALAVVDVEGGATPDAKDKDPKSIEDDQSGVRVVIRLIALGEGGEPLPSVNEQATYLHIVRLGAAPADDVDEDVRPWVVKVVKREAVIGKHTFHLHEIYGLSATSSAPPASAGHTYPPAPTDDDPASECLLCLSSPREVVLLPCRHLVACRDCALNMIEFGAGGTIAQPEAEEAAGAEGAAATEGTEAPAAAATGDAATGETLAQAAAAPTPAAPARRKRKAKGWFCPVCRQPYSSLLRITSAPLSSEKQEIKETEANATSVPASPNPAATAPTSGVTGALGAIPRPGFLRNWSLRSQAPQPTAPIPAATADAV